MGAIILLALGAAVFPTLLACVAILVSRPQPRTLLLAFYAGGLLTSLTAGIAVLLLFNQGNDVLGSTASTPNPRASISAGFGALILAWLMASGRGHALIDRWRSRHPRRRAKPEGGEGPSWAERRLDRASARVAFVVGAAINLPGPFYLLALGDISAGDYSAAEQLALVLLFNAIMFLLLEIPLIGYLVRPDTTAARVGAFSRWLNANGLRVMGWLVGFFGVTLIVQGVAALAG
jgi:hypothetical protein